MADNLNELRELVDEIRGPAGDPDSFVEVGGERLPVKAKTVGLALKYPWFTVNPEFNRVFYRALRRRGVDYETTKEAIRALSRSARALGLTDRQVRGAWGLEKGVFNSLGNWSREAFGDDVRDMVKAGVLGRIGEGHAGGRGRRGRDRMGDGWYGGVFRPSEFRLVVEDAVKSSKGKVDRVGIELEIEWVAANSMEWPDFKTAPSRGAVKWWLAVMSEKSVFRDFWSTWLTKRLTPGDGRGRRLRPAVLGEGDDEFEEQDQDLRLRLGLADESGS